MNLYGMKLSTLRAELKTSAMRGRSRDEIMADFWRRRRQLASAKGVQKARKRAKPHVKEGSYGTPFTRHV